MLKNRISRLEVIWIELTYKCNMSCSWCFNEFSIFYENKKQELSIKRIMFFLNLIFLIRKRLGFDNKVTIILTWWEPLLFNKIDLLIYEITKLKSKYLFDLQLNTNGLLIKNFKSLSKIKIILFSYNLFDWETIKNLKEKEYGLKFIKKNFKWTFLCSTRINNKLLNNLSEIKKFY